MDNLSNDIKPLQMATMADMVELKLREYLKKKSFRPGDPLPKEQELADALEVSRNVVREALSRLRMLGIIDSRKKRGMILTEPDVLGTFERVLDPLIMNKDTRKDLFELRLILEMGLADLIFVRMTEQDLVEIEEIVSKEPKKNSTPMRIEHEIAFHGKLYSMTRNETFSRFQNMLLPTFQYVVENEQTVNGEPTSGKMTHSDLVSILKNGNPDEFRAAMREHLQPHFALL